VAAVGIVLAWAGYSLFYYGLDQVKGGNNTIMELVWPGRYKVVAKDGGAVANPNGQYGGVGGREPTFNPKTGAANPGTGYAPGGGVGPGGTGYGTGNAPGYTSDPNSPAYQYYA